jgi:transcriptional regulator with XRE-family HTH domain
MFGQLTNLEEGDIALPTSSLDLSTQIRSLRARLRLTQRELGQRMKLDSSIPGLWELGKRPVPANRVRSLADALEVTVTELLEGVTGAAPTVESIVEPAAHSASVELLDDRVVRNRPADNRPLLSLLPHTPDEQPDTPDEQPEPEQLGGDIPSEPWVVPERPPLAGWIPDGWQPTDRVPDITPSLPDGYWLDPIKLEKATARQLLRSRLCADDQSFVGGRDVPGAALAERLYCHCSKEEAFMTLSRLPVAETIFRSVLAADSGGLTDGALVELLRERAYVIPVSTTLLGRLRDAMRVYPIRRVDAGLFGGRR